ncbi:hypothetical protein [Vibrio kanaloae]|uniref:hypothetical protein n=1 Tax=Vibrio kanaloae TaxID=170673 RepID=UPI001F0D96D1|nr:hypothetical protein [Vibrio kanaloae]
MKSLWIAIFSLLLSACSSSIPKEVVELSYKMDKDMTHVEQAYADLVRQHIAVLKKTARRLPIQRMGACFVGGLDN